MRDHSFRLGDGIAPGSCNASPITLPRALDRVAIEASRARACRRAGSVQPATPSGRKCRRNFKCLKYLVGVAGFEPATPSSRTL